MSKQSKKIVVVGIPSSCWNQKMLQDESSRQNQTKHISRRAKQTRSNKKELWHKLEQTCKECHVTHKCVGRWEMDILTHGDYSLWIHIYKWWLGLLKALLILGYKIIFTIVG